MNKFWNWTPVRNAAEGEPARELSLEGVIAEESWWGDEVTPQMFRDELNAGKGPIRVRISSPGGDCIAASRIYTMLMDYPYDVEIRIEGLAASAASVIAMAGTRTFMSPTALMMIHNPMTIATGDEGEMKAAIELLREVKESIINAYQIKTSLSRDELARLMDKETWMDANKALELGFADGILFAEAEEEEKKEPEEGEPEEGEPEEGEPEEGTPEEGEPEEDPDEDEEKKPEDEDEDEEKKIPENLRILRVAARSTERLIAARLREKVLADRAPVRPAKQPEGKAAPVIASAIGPEQEAAQREAVRAAYARKHNDTEGTNMDIKNLRGAYLKSAITRAPLAPEVQNALTITTGANPGNGLLPVEVSRSLISDIYGEDRLLEKLTHTQIKGLRVPGVTAVSAADAVRSPDGSTAAGETVLTDAVVTFGRYPGREKIVVPSAILRGTETDLNAYITQRLTRDHRANMRARLFAAASTTGDLAHMSVYTTGSGNPGITAITGATTLAAIQAAIAALPEGVRDEAVVVMTYAQWMDLIATLANGAATLFGSPTKEILGFDVVTCDYITAAGGMLVGDLATIHINYDDPLWLKTDEDIDLDMTKVVIGYDYDIRVEDPNRLRLAKVGA